MDFITRPTLPTHQFIQKAIIEGKQLRDFIFAGNATFTVLNTKSKNRFTFKIKKHKNDNIFFVTVMTGSDNYNSYTFLGTYFPPRFGEISGIYKKSMKSRIGGEAQSSKVISWFFSSFINNQSNYDSIKVYHEDKCGRCGRKLTTPESVKSGFGPECTKLMGKTKGK